MEIAKMKMAIAVAIMMRRGNLFLWIGLHEASGRWRYRQGFLMVNSIT